MSNSLQEQLQKAGLVDEKQAKKIKQERRKISKQQQHKKKHKPIDPSLLKAQQAASQKAERDRELNRQLEVNNQQKATVAQIKQLIKNNRKPQDDDDIAYNFIDDKIVKRLFVSKVTHDALSRGLLAIVKLEDQYDIVPGEIAEKIRLRDEKCVILLNEPQQSNHADDPYAAYQVPDDLSW